MASASRLCVASASASPVGVAGSSCQERGGDARRLGVVHFLQVAQRSSCRGPEWRLPCRGRDPQRASCPGLQQGLGTLDPVPLQLFFLLALVTQRPKLPQSDMCPHARRPRLLGHLGGRGGRFTRKEGLQWEV